MLIVLPPVVLLVLIHEAPPTWIEPDLNSTVEPFFAYTPYTQLSVASSLPVTPSIVTPSSITSALSAVIAPLAFLVVATIVPSPESVKVEPFPTLNPSLVHVMVTSLSNLMSALVPSGILILVSVPLVRSILDVISSSISSPASIASEIAFSTSSAVSAFFSYSFSGSLSFLSTSILP